MLEIMAADEATATRYAAELCELVWATGPSSYTYHFAERSLFDALVTRSLRTAGTLFAWDGMHVALDGDALLGALIAFPGPEYRKRQSALGPLWPDMITAGEVETDAIGGVIDRSRRASWLNPALLPDVYYVHAISVTPAARGRKVGASLLEQAMEDGRAHGSRALELDVLSDNPAIGFYRSRGLELLVESRAPDPEANGVPPEWRMGVTLPRT